MSSENYIIIIDAIAKKAFELASSSSQLVIVLVVLHHIDDVTPYGAAHRPLIIISVVVPSFVLLLQFNE